MIRNPVLRRELLMRVRLRQPTPARIGVGIAIVVVLGSIYYQIITHLLADPSLNAARNTWNWVVGFQHVLICLAAPAITANAIAQEKEQQTWEMLIFTRLRPDEIVLGKLLARMTVLLLIMAVILPVSLFCAIHADASGKLSDSYISLGQFCRVYLTTFLSGLFFSTFGLFMSWMLKRTIYALIASYTFVVGGLMLTTTLITLMIQMVVSDPNFIYTCPLMWFNPIVLLAEALLPTQYFSQATLYLGTGLTCYVLILALLIWRMIAGFRIFAED